MRTGIAYTSARILMLGVSVILLYLAGARGFLLLGLAFVISALASYILLNKQRQLIAERLNRRLSRVGEKASEFRERLAEGAAAEDAAAGDAAAGDAAEPGADARGAADQGADARGGNAKGADARGGAAGSGEAGGGQDVAPGAVRLG